MPQSDHAAEERKTSNIGGVAQYLNALKDYTTEVPYEATDSWLQKKLKEKADKKERLERTLKEGLERSTLFLSRNSFILPFSRSSETIEDIMLIDMTTDPNDDPNIRGDAFKTLFVARLSYDTREKDLEREFGRFGPIERVQVFHLVLLQAAQRLTARSDTDHQR